jgi:rubrerythrin
MTSNLHLVNLPQSRLDHIANEEDRRIAEQFEDMAVEDQEHAAIMYDVARQLTGHPSLNAAASTAQAVAAEISQRARANLAIAQLHRYSLSHS